MKLTVLPEMKKLFVAFDAKRYQKMTCTTCHSDKGPDVKFKMPNPSLPKLPAPGDRACFMAIQQKKPEAVKFMGTQVKPKMAELLGLPEWQMNNPTGFGCYQCHTNEGPAAAPAAPTRRLPGAPRGARETKGGSLRAQCLRPPSPSSTSPRRRPFNRASWPRCRRRRAM